MAGGAEGALRVLLFATLQHLSAQATDKSVNLATRTLERDGKAKAKAFADQAREYGQIAPSAARLGVEIVNASGVLVDQWFEVRLADPETGELIPMDGVKVEAGDPAVRIELEDEAAEVRREEDAALAGDGAADDLLGEVEVAVLGRLHGLAGDQELVLLLRHVQLGFGEACDRHDDLVGVVARLLDVVRGIAVAAGLAPIATGTDTGGSIRQPAAFCGLTGIKPSYGRVSRYGMIAYASSLDQAGPMGKSAEDCALLLTAMSSHDPRDSTSLADSGEDYGRYLNQGWQEGNTNLTKPLEGLRIGLPKEFFAEGLAADVAKSVNEAAKILESLGAKLVEVSLPKTKLSIPVYYVLAPAEASSNLSRFDGVRYGLRANEYKDLGDMYQKSRTEGFGAEVKRRIMIGTYVLCHGYYDAYYLQAQKIRRIIAADFQAAFKECDVILGPVAPDVAWRLGEKSKDPVQMYLEDIYTLSTNLAGLPAMSAPCGFNANNLPIGMQ